MVHEVSQIEVSKVKLKLGGIKEFKTPVVHKEF